MQGLDKRANGRIVDLLLHLGDGAEDLVTGGVVPEVFFDSLPDLERDGRKHSLSPPSNIVAVRVKNRVRVSPAAETETESEMETETEKETETETETLHQAPPIVASGNRR